MKIKSQGDSTHELLFPGRRHPYYIVAPPYKRASAGVVTLHVLCHLLNRAGYPAYLAVWPPVRGMWGYQKLAMDNKLITPVLNDEALQSHFADGLTPITIYPETIEGNPLYAPLVVRYVLYYAGQLGGDRSYPRSEFVVAFSEKIKASLARCDGVISFPVADPLEFIPKKKPKKRTQDYYYAEKYLTAFHKKIPERVAQNARRISRDEPDSMTREQLVEALQSARFLYAFEDSAIIYEALLAGAAVIMMRNPHFRSMLAEHESGWAGIARDESPAEIQRALRTVGDYPKSYERWMQASVQHLQAFIAATQEKARAIPYRAPMAVTDGAFRRKKPQAYNDVVHNTLPWFIRELYYGYEFYTHELPQRLARFLRRRGWLSEQRRRKRG